MAPPRRVDVAAVRWWQIAEGVKIIAGAVEADRGLVAVGAGRPGGCRDATDHTFSLESQGGHGVRGDQAAGDERAVPLYETAVLIESHRRDSELGAEGAQRPPSRERVGCVLEQSEERVRDG